MSIAKLMESARLESEPGGRLKVFVDNKIQLELLKAELPAFRERLVSGDLAVPEISLEIQPDTRHDENQIPHSAQDRLAQMARKNPLVEQLRDKLGLELEF